MKEPHGLVRDDGMPPDGLTLLPWNSGRSATWDVTVVDTLGNAHLQQSAITSASAAETATVSKRNKYSTGNTCQHPGVLGTNRKANSQQVTTDPRETTFFFQRLSVTVQRFNAACLDDTFAIFEPAS